MNSQQLAYIVNGETQSENPNQRKSGRRKQEMLRSSLGQVLDISRGGMRIMSVGPADGVIDVTIDSFLGEFTVSAEVCWSRQCKPQQYELGLSFENLTKEQGEQLTKIATVHALNPSMDSAPPAPLPFPKRSTRS